jgi:hypothetical protein
MGFFTILWASAIFRKVLLYGAIAAGVLLALKWYANRAYYQGVEQGRVLGVTELVKAKEKEWAEKERALVAQKGDLDAQAQTLSAQQEALTKNKIAIKTDLNKSIAALRVDLNAKYVSLSSIPVTELEVAIQRSLAELRAP